MTETAKALVTVWGKIKIASAFFLIGIRPTALVIGCEHIRLDFRIDPDELELKQTEKLDKQLSGEVKKINTQPAVKPVGKP